MPAARKSTYARIWGAATAALGLAMVVRPGRVADLAAGRGAVPPALLVRVLGARQVVQGAAVMAAADRREVLVTGGVVDLLHGSSMVAAALVWPRYRRASLVSATLAAGSAAVGAALLPGTRESRRWHR